MFPANGDGALAHVPRRPSCRTDYRDFSPARLFAAQVDEETQEAGSDWPAWTDVPAEFLDYEAFDDQGHLIREGGP